MDISNNIDNSFNVTLDLTSLIMQKITNSDFNKTIKLNKDSTDVIQLILTKYPKLLDNMGVHIKRIISDNIINSKDIPEILLLLSDALNLNVSELNKLKLTRSQVINFVKDVFIILIQSDIIKTGSDENKNLCLNLLDISIKLLETKINVKKVITCSFL
jgi:hypothetical protein